MSVTRFKSKSKLHVAHMEWTVAYARELMKRKEAITSPFFACKGDSNGALWSVQLDFGNVKEGHMTITCANQSPTEVFVDTCDFGITDKKGKNLLAGSSFTDLLFGGAMTETASKQFVLKSDLSELSIDDCNSKVVQDGNMYLFCVIRYASVLKTKQVGGKTYKPKDLNKIKMDSIELQNSIKADILADFDLLFLSHDTADVTLKVGDAHFPVHRCILSARSPAFKRMFYSSPLLPTAPTRNDVSSPHLYPNPEVEVGGWSVERCMSSSSSTHDSLLGVNYVPIVPFA